MLGLGRRLGRAVGGFVTIIKHLTLRDSDLKELRDSSGRTLTVRME